jgi:hypothetical protein
MVDCEKLRLSKWRGVFVFFFDFYSWLLGEGAFLTKGECGAYHTGL